MSVCFQIQNEFWILLFDFFWNFGTGGQRTRHLPAPSHRPDFAQRDGRHSQSAFRRRSYPIFDTIVRKPSDGHPKLSGGVRITLKDKKLNDTCTLRQLPISRVDQGLYYLEKGRVFSLFDLVSSYYRITAHRDAVLFKALCAATGLNE